MNTTLILIIGIVTGILVLIGIGIVVGMVMMWKQIKNLLKFKSRIDHVVYPSIIKEFEKHSRLIGEKISTHVANIEFQQIVDRLDNFNSQTDRRFDKFNEKIQAQITELKYIQILKGKKNSPEEKLTVPYSD